MGAVISLALGIGSPTAMCNVIYSALLHPFNDASSEVDSCAQEHISGRIRAARLPKRGVLELRIDHSKVDSIEEVERIKTQLQVDALRDTCRLFQRKVSVCV